MGRVLLVRFCFVPFLFGPGFVRGLSWAMLSNWYGFDTGRPSKSTSGPAGKHKDNTIGDCPNLSKPCKTSGLVPCLFWYRVCLVPVCFGTGFLLVPFCLVSGCVGTLFVGSFSFGPFFVDSFFLGRVLLVRFCFVSFSFGPGFVGGLSWAMLSN